tara:strand:- start:335 stop:625 length:291 start_codon:yes stop_codon:yes gene_type:complete
MCGEMMRGINMKSILFVSVLGLIGLQLWKNRDVLSAESLNAHEGNAPVEVRDLYGSVVLVEGQQSQNALAYNQTGGYELDTIVHSLGQNYSGRIMG